MAYDPFTFTSGDIITEDRINSLRAFDLTDSNLSSTANISWVKLNKTGSSLSDLSTRSASDLNSGTLPNSVFPNILPSSSAINLTNLNASSITTGVVSESVLPNISWSKINKTGSSLADLSTRTTSNLTDFPSQTTNGGKFLTTNGSTLSWANSSEIVPIGSIQALAYVPSVLPTGYLACDGSAISRTTYADLFSIIGTTYGSGDLSTTFNLPDLRGVFLRGLDQGKGYDPGRVIGTYQADDNKAHVHQYTAYRQPTAGFSVSYTGGGNTEYGTFDTSSTGSEARPKNIAIVYVIKF